VAPLREGGGLADAEAPDDEGRAHVGGEPVVEREEDGCGREVVDAGVSVDEDVGDLRKPTRAEGVDGGARRIDEVLQPVDRGVYVSRVTERIC